MLAWSSTCSTTHVTRHLVVVIALSAVFVAVTSCGARTELMRREPCNTEGLRRGCRAFCGTGEQVCRDGYWNPCEVAPTTGPCSNDCGAGQRTCADGRWGKCEVPVADRPCSDTCGTGTEQCVDG